MSLGKTDELDEDISKVRKLTKAYPSLERNMLFIYFLEAKQNYKSKQYSFFSDIFQQTILAHIKKFRQEEDYLTVLLFIYFTLAHLATGDAQSAQFFLRRLRILAKNLDGSYTQFFNILDLISHYETDDILIIHNLLNSFKRKQKWPGGKSPFFEEVLLFFNELCKNNNPPKAKFARELKSKSQNFEEDGVRNLLKVFILDDWLGAIIKGIKYTEYCNPTIQPNMED